MRKSTVAKDGGFQLGFCVVVGDDNEELGEVSIKLFMVSNVRQLVGASGRLS